jgi:REP element-mobilizing transposase RayT
MLVGLQTIDARLVEPPSLLELRERAAVLRKLPSRWTRSYFAATVGNVSNETVQRYLAAPKGL